MNRSLKVHRIFPLLLAASITVPGTGIVGQNSAPSVEGVVLEQGTNNALSRATLNLRSLDNSGARYPAITSGEGKFSFRSIPPGRYSLVAVRAGYLRAEYGQRGPNGAASIVEVGAGQSLRDIRIWLIPSAVISGRVYDIKGEPAVNAQMHAWRVSYAEGWRKLLPVTSQVTNDLGEYRLFGLPPGQYYVSAQPEPRSFVRSPAYASLAPPLPGMVILNNTAGGSGGTADPANSRLAGADFAPIYFGGAASEYSATPMTVRAGDDLRGIDIPVERITMAPLTGTVIDSVTRQPVRATLTVTPFVPNVFFTGLTTINVTGGVLSVTATRPIASAVNGQFRTEPLPHGSYVITAIVDQQGSRLAGQAVADSRNPDPAGVRITVAPAFEISGQIGLEGVPAMPNVKVGLLSMASQPLDVPAVTPSSNGSFTLRGVTPGNYLVQVTAFSNAPASGGSIANAYVKSAHLANTDVLNDGLRVDRVPEGRLEILIAGNPGKVNGSVSEANRQPLAGVTTVLVPEDRNRVDLYRSASTDASGQYLFDSVSPGRYRLFAWEDVERNAWRDPGFMTAHEDRGLAIAVDAGGSHTAALTAIPPR